VAAERELAKRHKEDQDRLNSALSTARAYLHVDDPAEAELLGVDSNGEGRWTYGVRIGGLTFRMVVAESGQTGGRTYRLDYQKPCAHPECSWVTSIRVGSLDELGPHLKKPYHCLDHGGHDW
jgi:hypothetical protein